METRYMGIGTLMTQAVPYLGTDLDRKTKTLKTRKEGTLKH